MIEYRVQKGPFIKQCPCSPQAVSCGYYNANIHLGCPYSCSYCILQSYLDSKKPVFFTNLDDWQHELDTISAQERFLRLGSGELADSLALDQQTGYSLKIMDLIGTYSDIVFEFKTKSIFVDNILKFPRVLTNVVVSWSLNPDRIIRGEEYGAPSLMARLKAMVKVQERGYKIGIHFDPLIYINGWQDQYLELIKNIAGMINPGRVAWWSLGALRFPQPLRHHLFKYPQSHLFQGELIKGLDGKYRYFKPLRLELFSFVKKTILEQVSRHVPLYLCMEDKQTWDEILPELKADREYINEYLYHQVIK